MTSQGKKMETLPMNFHVPLEERIRAAAGIPAYIRRLRRIEDLTEALVQALDEIFEGELYATQGDEQTAWQAVRNQVQHLDLELLNDLIARHNEYYPIEANLPVEPATGKFLYLGKPWKPLEPMSAEQLYRRFEQQRKSSRT